MSAEVSSFQGDIREETARFALFPARKDANEVSSSIQ